MQRDGRYKNSASHDIGHCRIGASHEHIDPDESYERASRVHKEHH